MANRNSHPEEHRPACSSRDQEPIDDHDLPDPADGTEGAATASSLNEALSRVLSTLLEGQCRCWVRTIDGVHTVYATKPLLPSLVGAVVEAVRNDPVGMHLVTVTEDDDSFHVAACIGISADESASDICRRAHDALRSHLRITQLGERATISVKIGRVG